MESKVADNIEATLAEIKGTLSVIKSWGIGVAGIVSAIGLTSLGYLIAVNSQISDLKVEVSGIKTFQQVEARQQLSDIKKSIDQLLAEKTPSPEAKQPSLKRAPKN